ncbi:MAG: S-methyl-5-thioribose-1-phosphate isomerase [Desulfosarcinaceae bacterium]|nr:S-methyl-5-thioribose-1-phosphate isomerase [Desulfosarcinaceae bacterium]
MQRASRPKRPIWLGDDPTIVHVIDQRQLPHHLVVAPLRTVDEMIIAIQEMYVRGAPLIGVSGAYGTMLAAIAATHHNEPLAFFKAECDRLKAARPTAVNLAWAVDRALEATAAATSPAELVEITRELAADIAEEEVENCRRIGQHGVELIRALSERKDGGTVNILTHCNAGWLACVEWGTATAPVYAAAAAGLDVHVWVDETRPLNQGARLTAWELGRQGVPHTVITDNAGGHLMQHGRVDLVIVGTDRTTHTGDVANKIGTYLKALAAHDNEVPFYVALPSSTFDWQMRDGLAEIPIEERDPDEVRQIQGLVDGEVRTVLVPPLDSPAGNYAFDVTPSRLVTGFITERGICGASEAEIHRLFPDK